MYFNLIYRFDQYSNKHGVLLRGINTRLGDDEASHKAQVTKATPFLIFLILLNIHYNSTKRHQHN